MNHARWRAIATLMGLLAGIGGCGEGITDTPATHPSDTRDTVPGNGDGDERLSPPCLLAEPEELTFGGQLCQWTWTKALTLRTCGETPVSIDDVALETGESSGCVGHHCEYYVVAPVSPITLAAGETTEVFVHYSPPDESAVGADHQPIFDRATVLVLFDGGPSETRLPALPGPRQTVRVLRCPFHWG